MLVLQFANIFLASRLNTSYSPATVKLYVTLSSFVCVFLLNRLQYVIRIGAYATWERL